MSMMKLSERLAAWRKDGKRSGTAFDDYIALARALEERVAELEAASRAKGVGIKAFSSQLAAATARAEAAEAKLKWIEETQRTQYDVEARAAAAEGEVARLREDLNDAQNGWESASAEVWRLDAKMEKVRAEVKMGLAKLEGGTAHNHYEWILRHIDGEGDDEA